MTATWAEMQALVGEYVTVVMDDSCSPDARVTGWLTHLDDEGEFVMWTGDRWGMGWPCLRVERAALPS